MHSTAGKAVLGLSLAVAVILITRLAGSEPVREKILDELDIQKGEESTSVQISLTSRVRYIHHFPYEPGEELRIRIQLFDMGNDNREARFGRETLVPYHSEDLPLEEVVYEGDNENGPNLTLFFNRPVQFEVRQGTDSRSIVVHITEPAPGALTLPLPETDED